MKYTKKTKIQKEKTELLAPAGSLKAFFAAIDAGADAVYCGLKEFSARAKAKNFPLEEMELLTTYAHGKNRRLYVAINTLIKEAELPKLIVIIARLVASKVDGLIIQDLGLWKIIRDHFPEIELHASTQMAIHNIAGVQMLEKMGFKRAVLARELTINEISAIGKKTHIELEHFVHGALCFSISGQCFFSSYLSGNSGNRGRCAQPCRRRYSHRGKSGFYFSTSDLCAIEMLPQLIAAGVMSFKIEGRMKNSEYVATVVSAYRKVLDAGPNNQNQAIKEAQKILTDSYGRATTTGFLKGHITADIARSSREGGIGQQLGQVKHNKSGIISFETANTIHVGDRLRIQPLNDQSGTAFTIKELFIEQKKKKRAEAGNHVRIPTPFGNRFQPGDTVYKVAAGRSFTNSEESCQRRLDNIKPLMTKIDLQISCKENLLLMVAKTEHTSLTKQYEAEMFPASQSPLNHKTLLKTFQKTGFSQLQFNSLVVKDLLPVVIQPSRLKEIRRDFYSILKDMVLSSSEEKIKIRINQAQNKLLPSKKHTPASKTHITLKVRNSRDLETIGSSGIDKFLLPLTPENVDFIYNKAKRFKKFHKQIIWDIPAIIYEDQWSEFKYVIRQLQKMDFKYFQLNNLGHFQLFKHSAGIRLTAGPLLYVLNSSASQTLKELGTEAFTYSFEDDKNNMTALSSTDTGQYDISTVYGPIAVISSRIPMRIKGSQKCLENEAGQSFGIDSSTGLTVIHGDSDFSLLGQIYELKQMGCENYVIDLSHTSISSKTAKKILMAVQNDQTLPGTTLMNFDRGLE